MKFIELFAGIGAFRLGLERTGHECVWANEWLEKPRKIYGRNFPDGAFIWAEKVVGRDAEWERIFNHSYFDFKRKSFSADAILDKEQDLRRIMHPLTTNQNLHMVRLAGFESEKMNLIWKNYNFECFVMVK